MDNQPDTLASRLATLPAHVSLDFRAIPVAGREVWYAYWQIEGKPFARRLGQDENGLIAREIARRRASAERIVTPAQVKKPDRPRRTYSQALMGDYRTCTHQYGKISLVCDTCRAWHTRHPPRRVTAMVWKG